MSEQISLLQVDDDDDIRAITELSLSLEPGFTLHQCASGQEAIELAPKLNPDVFLLDMMMPGMNGEETWKHLRDELGMQETPAIFMSARAEEEFARRLLGQGAAGVITKPFDPLTLGQQIRDILAECTVSGMNRDHMQTNKVLPFGV